MSVPPSGTTTTRSPQQSAASLFGDVKSTSDAIERGDWLTAGVGITNVAMDVIGIAGDPLGAISSAGFGWLIGHIKFLREPFDILLGDPSSIGGSAQGWARACTELAATAERYRAAADQQTKGWTGPAADNYRTCAATQARNLDTLSKISKGVSDALAGAGKVLAEVRKAVIDTINQACDKIIMIIIEALAAAWGSFGASIAKGIAHSVQTAVSAAQKMLTKIQKLVSTLQKVMQLVQKIMQLAQAVKQLLEMIGGGANPGDGMMRPLPVGPGVPINYAGNISAGTSPSGSTTTVNRQTLDPGPGYHYDGFGPSGQLPPGVPSWGPSGPPPDRGHPASRVDQARWISSTVRILIELGVDPARIDTGRIAEIITQSSGGNPHAVNFADPSAQNGYPPKGLMMITDPVFQEHKVPGYNNIYQPVDNLLAGTRYLIMVTPIPPGLSRPNR